MALCAIGLRAYFPRVVATKMPLMMKDATTLHTAMIT
jgi:hypothetical protein